MINIIDWILDLFRHEDAARAFVAAPDQTLRDAGLAGVPAAQLSAVAATAVPGMVLGDGDPVVGLQRAVSNHYGFAPAAEWSPNYAPSFAPSPTFAPQTDLASHNQTDLLSHNDTALLSPDQSAGANSQQGGFNLGFGDIVLGGSKTTANGDGAVAVSGHVHGSIVSGDGAVLGNDNNVNNGDVWAGTGSNVSVGHGGIEDHGTTNTGSGSVIKDNGGSVFQDVDASGGHGGGASGGDSLIGIGSGNSHGGDAGGGGIIVVNKDTTNVAGNQTHVGGDSDSGNSVSSPTPHGDRKPRHHHGAGLFGPFVERGRRQLDAAQRVGLRQQPRHVADRQHAGQQPRPGAGVRQPPARVLTEPNTRGNGGDRHGPRRCGRLP